MLAEHLESHRKKFYSLSSVWMRVGATCVQLLEGDQVLISFPGACSDTSNALVVHSRTSNLTLRIYGLKDDSWRPTAETVIDVMANLLTADSDLDDLTSALIETQDRLVAIYELTQATRRTLEIPALLDLLIQESKHLLNVEGGFAVLLERGKPSVVHQISESPLHPAHLEAATTLFRRDPSRHTFNDSETLPAGMRNVMMVSLPVRDEIFAAFGVFNQTGTFTTPDIKLAKAIAGHIGAQLENAFLHKESLERTRLETEMDIARQVQSAILPQSLPQMEGLDIYATSKPALEVGGDFFDVIDRAKGSLVFTVGDVTGKGMPAALLMSMSHTVIKSASRKMPFTQPHQVMDRLNHDLFDDFSNVGMFTTVFIGLLDQATSTLKFSNAGHSPIFYIPAGKEPVLLEAQDVPIGILDTYEYMSQSIQLSQGDIFVVASDGFPESRNSDDEMFGYERMKQSLEDSRNMPAKEMVETLLNDVNAFSMSHGQDDDRTILIIKVAKEMQFKTFTVKATYKDVRIPAEYLRELLTSQHVAEDIINGCELAMQELLVNLVDHAYEGDAQKEIKVAIDCDGHRVLIETEDTGIPANVNLNHTSMPAPTDLAEGGYGMALIQMLMDDVTCETSQGKNVWRLTKKL
ncbi:MAG: SpoIIE family protein phosphatase [Anaerolineales bacterium]